MENYLRHLLGFLVVYIPKARINHRRNIAQHKFGDAKIRGNIIAHTMASF